MHKVLVVSLFRKKEENGKTLKEWLYYYISACQVFSTKGVIKDMYCFLLSPTWSWAIRSSCLLYFSA